MESINYFEINCSSALNKLKRKFPYQWDLNIYRGCEHSCKYCYAVYSHKYLEDNNFFGSIYVKTNILEILEKELSSNSWEREIINIGGTTDSYQPAEAKYKLMPQILKLLIKYKTPAIISTKSNLILRDFDLIDKLSRITYVNVASTVTTMSEEVRKHTEPNGIESKKRFDMLKEFKKTNASIGLHVMPIIPYITDTSDNLDAIFFNASKSGVDYVLLGTLYLRGQTRKFFFDFIKLRFPHLFEDFSCLYRKGGADKEYKNKLYKAANELRGKYRLSSDYSKLIKEKLRK